MRGRNRIWFILVAVSGLLMALLLLSGVAMAEDFTADAVGGFGVATNDNVLSMAEYDGKLFVGTGAQAVGASCEVWYMQGDTWTDSVGANPGALLGPGFGNPANKFVWSMAVYNGELYAGTGNTGGCEVWSFNGAAWTEIVGPGAGAMLGPGFGNAANTDVYSLAVYGGVLYAGTSNGGGCEVWAFNGTAWAEIVGPGVGAMLGPGFGNAANTDAYSMAVYAGSLYAGTQNGGGCEVWVFNGTAWTEIVGPGAGALIGSGFGNAANSRLNTLAVYAGELYAGTQNGGGCEVWAFNGTAWTEIVGPGAGALIGSGFGNAANFIVQRLVVFSNELYAGTSNGATGCEVWRCDGSSFVMVVGGAGTTPSSSGFGSAANIGAWSGMVYNLSLYWGTWNNAGCEVWSTKTAPTWFLAEGATAGGFETWVLIENPTPNPVPINIVFQTQAGPVQGPIGDLVPAESRVSYLVNTYVPDNFDVSTSVTAYGGDLICERAEYWTPPGAPYRILGHDSIGVVTAAPVWYLAEGATGPNANGSFETWVLVQNPNPVPVEIGMDFQTSGGSVPGPVDTIDASSRRSYKVNDYVTDLNVSTKVTSLTPGEDIICERAMYWTPAGTTTRVVGHDSKGVTLPAPNWYLAEGATAGGFETWVLVQNPNAYPVNINMDFQTQGGLVNGPTGETIPAGSRVSYRVNNYVPDNFDVSTSVESIGGNVICERAMYWVPTGGTRWQLGHDSCGVTMGGLTWYLPEGSTLGGFETWVLVQNPNPAPVTVDLQFQTDVGPIPGPGDPPLTDVIPANSRKTYRVNDYVSTFDVSTKVTSTAGGFIICERAVYWSPPGLDRILGTDSIGFDP